MSKVIPEWKSVLKTAYSVWFAFAALLLLHASDLIYVRYGVDTNPESWTWILTWFLIAVIVSRFIPQPETHKWKRRGGVILFILVLASCTVPAMASPDPSDQSSADRAFILADPFDRAVVPLVMRWEGKHMRGGWHVAYLDIVGVPTFCYGSTRGVQLGMRATEIDCQLLLAEEIAEYRAGLNPAFSDDTLARRLPPEREAAFVSLAYNVGVRAASRSTAVRRLNAGKIAPACEALTWWNKAGGRVVRGLVNRRSEERAYCLRGL